ncbi:GIY-YIG nuclease family protein [Spirosoma linguale]|uniref:Excinuclease ABC C subunit domain protein n=1 Tax=Spirosoma linguale (strain ATCC 33905 / DSM 74 / LMG 10896 / Claus 1) TaxID=504472 RepID=D2QQN8_SPILD|nr:Excinuclease ABC C subunit domain protein [Spirosoma linguale DSM 74]
MTVTDLYWGELVAFYTHSDYAGLINYCTDKLTQDPTHYLLYGARGKAYLELEEYTKAIDDLSASLLLNETYGMGLYNRGIAYYFSSNYTAAIDDLQAANQQQIQVNVDYFVGLCYYYTEQYESAIHLFSSVLDSAQADEYILECRANAYTVTGQSQLAARDQLGLLQFHLDAIPELETINAIDSTPSPVAEVDTFWSCFTEMCFLSQTGSMLSGIYILRFTNQEFYVGKAKNISNRLKQHHRTYSDIERIYFKAVALQVLLDEENATIAHMQRMGLRIRNLKQLSFLDLFNTHHQRRWVNQLDYSFISGTKYDNQAIREKFTNQFKSLQQRSYCNELIRLLSAYIEATIPNYLASEYNYWSISCLPKYLKKDKCVSRINIHAVPVLSVFEENDTSLTMILFVSKLPFLTHQSEKGSLEYLIDHLPSLQIEFKDAFQPQTQGDELTLVMNQGDFEKALQIPIILASCRLFNLRMMNRTGNEIGHRRTVWHCLDLADAIHQTIGSPQASERIP